jgi:hypothetical protein
MVGSTCHAGTRVRIRSFLLRFNFILLSLASSFTLFFLSSSAPLPSLSSCNCLYLFSVLLSHPRTITSVRDLFFPLYCLLPLIFSSPLVLSCPLLLPSPSHILYQPFSTPSRSNGSVNTPQGRSHGPAFTPVPWAECDHWER